jgi:hypothetical protein
MARYSLPVVGFCVGYHIGSLSDRFIKLREKQRRANQIADIIRMSEEVPVCQRTQRFQDNLDSLKRMQIDIATQAAFSQPTFVGSAAIELLCTFGMGG